MRPATARRRHYLVVKGLLSILVVWGSNLSHSYFNPRGSRVQTRPVSMDFSERKNPEYDFLRKGRKAVGPVTSIYGT